MIFSQAWTEICEPLGTDIQAPGRKVDRSPQGLNFNPLGACVRCSWDHTDPWWRFGVKPFVPRDPELSHRCRIHVQILTALPAEERKHFQKSPYFFLPRTHTRCNEQTGPLQADCKIVCQQGQSSTVFSPGCSSVLATFEHFGTKLSRTYFPLNIISLLTLSL